MQIMADCFGNVDRKVGTGVRSDLESALRIAKKAHRLRLPNE